MESQPKTINFMMSFNTCEKDYNKACQECKGSHKDVGVSRIYGKCEQDSEIVLKGTTLPRSITL